MIALDDLFGDDYDKSGIIEGLAGYDDVVDLGEYIPPIRFDTPQAKAQLAAALAADPKAKAAIAAAMQKKAPTIRFETPEAKAALAKALQKQAADKAMRDAIAKSPAAKAQIAAAMQKNAPIKFTAPTAKAALATALAKDPKAKAAIATAIRKAPPKKSAAKLGASLRKATEARKLKQAFASDAQAQRALREAIAKSPTAKAQIAMQRRGMKLPPTEIIRATSPEAYGLMACNGGVGGKSAIVLLRQIYALVCKADTQREATSEHNLIRNTDAYRRAVLDRLRRLSAQY